MGTLERIPEDMKNKFFSQIKSNRAWAGIAIAIVLALSVRLLAGRISSPNQTVPAFGTPQRFLTQIPPYSPGSDSEEISRRANGITEKIDQTRYAAIEYTVKFGDSVFGIANAFDISPETLLWANEDALGGNPDILEPGMQLFIPPVDGVYYKWDYGDSLEKVAGQFQVEEEAILNWAGNPIDDLLNPVIIPGTYVMIPGGQGEFRSWVIPVIPSGAAGVSRGLYGPGACSGSYTGVGGTGSFVWPSHIHDVVGNDYWAGHLALDIATGEGLEIAASDGGVVVFSGWANGGYGYMIMLDHLNRYHTLYAHLSSVSVHCGQSVQKGQKIGYGGSTGNSSGPHVHFELRFDGGFLNPWTVLP